MQQPAKMGEEQQQEGSRKPQEALWMALWGLWLMVSVVIIAWHLISWIIRIVSVIAWMAMLDSEMRRRWTVQPLFARQIVHSAVVGLICYQIAGGDLEQRNQLCQLSPGRQFAVTELLHGPRTKGLFARYPIGRIALALEHGRDIDPRPHNEI